ncbi:MULTISPECIES: Uma2 family endonuclease [unclassified Streptomyces]|uniref:Uma2 family endonuclease n=1 Tax=unclassified Streptomyces TaxID=2593676 RepID=UPI00224D21A5|nr:MULTISPECIES: Uma2 family endonuclease [unclassified Streptomyces]WSP56156.1 Uma2 family endonuclease [Streptomyces sp. NBC_01241]MCX4787859.1 Uma2 family endonuclease [Streptomyces sp. NBC_01221]MCX4796378.1 Uma2 family endonuclease [Streptomyces sp. NBC_01242]WSJ37615.1 Uma2 family endonuclease [Streptomyces sp. NBC_01321]WSP64013.1 Uma2 family endonuclease [Streptomyces sp. NBC_01240]
MGVVEESVLTQEVFEDLARHAIRTEEALRLEFVNGKLGVKAAPDGDHGRIIEWLTRLCMQADPDRWLYAEQGLRIETYRKGNARPDGALARSGAFVGQGEWAGPDGVLMVVEVTSYDEDTDRRDRVEKPRAYAETGIPVYLLIDRDTCEVKVHSQPDGVRYEQVVTVPYGKTVELPDPVGIELDTEPLKNWVR